MEPLRSADDFPVIVNTPCYFGFGNKPLPAGYWDDPAVMVRYQENGFQRHLSEVDDDTVPYFMPWFGTGVLASAFGCRVKWAKGDGDDPGICDSAVKSIEDLARLHSPDPLKDGLMPKILQFIDYARENSDLPVGLTDMNSPLSTAAQICGYDRLFEWMYDEPNAVHDLMDLITDTLISWTRLQKSHAGDDTDSSNGLQGIWSPKGVGVWASDDDLVSIGAEHYEAFGVPANSRLFEAFGGGHLHFCGNGLHQVENILKIKGLKAVNNSPLGRFEIFGEMAGRLSGRVAIQIQDVVPVDIEAYYGRLFSEIKDFRGVMLTTFVEDNLGVQLDGGTGPVSREPFEAARKVVRTVRGLVRGVIEG